VRKRAGVEHEVVLATKLLICFKMKTSVVCPTGVFNSCYENWAAVCIEYDQKGYEVECVPRNTVTGRILRRNEKIERVSKAVVEESVVWSVVAVFQWLVFVAVDLEDPEQKCGPTVVSGERHAGRCNYD